MNATRRCIFFAAFATMAFSLSGCEQNSQNGRPIAGTPDGTVETLVIAESGEVEHSEGSFLELVDRSDQKLVLVDFWASWCGPCRRLAPELVKIKKEWGDKIEVVKVDVDQNKDIARFLNIKAIPDVRIFRHGTQVASFGGPMPRAEIHSLLKSLE
jgi:thioredoxin 1